MAILIIKTGFPGVNYINLYQMAEKNLSNQPVSTQQLMDQHNQHEEHSNTGQFIKSAVYGGLDGLITTLSIALSGIGAATGSTVIVVLGISSLIADGLSMAVADYLATKSDAQYMKAQEERQRQEIQTCFEEQKQQMVTIYQEMGLMPQVSKEIVDILSTNKEGFLSIMMIEQLHLIPDEQSPFKNSIVTFFSFCIFGLMPLTPFLVADANNLTINSSYTAATICIAAFFLFVLGFGKSFVTSAKWYISTFETILIGALSAGAAFLIGWAVGQ